MADDRQEAPEEDVETTTEENGHIRIGMDLKVLGKLLGLDFRLHTKRINRAHICLVIVAFLGFLATLWTIFTVVVPGWTGNQ